MTVPWSIPPKIYGYFTDVNFEKLTANILLRVEDWQYGEKKVGKNEKLFQKVQQTFKAIGLISKKSEKTGKISKYTIIPIKNHLQGRVHYEKYSQEIDVFKKKFKELFGDHASNTDSHFDVQVVNSSPECSSSF